MLHAAREKKTPPKIQWKAIQKLCQPQKKPQPQLQPTNINYVDDDDYHYNGIIDSIKASNVFSKLDKKKLIIDIDAHTYKPLIQYLALNFFSRSLKKTLLHQKSVCEQSGFAFKATSFGFVFSLFSDYLKKKKQFDQQQASQTQLNGRWFQLFIPNIEY